jgi:hypothetical protein
MENKNIFELFNTIFSDSPKPSKSICLEIDVLDKENKDEITETQLSDLFEIFLHMFIYGFKKLNLTFTKESLSILKDYFASVGIKFDVEIQQFEPSTSFNDVRYKFRYCLIDPSSVSNSDDEPLFISNYKTYSRNKLPEYIAVYQYEYESMIFINFDFI